MIKYNKKPEQLHRPCDRCEGIFKPTGKFNRICDECRKNSRRNKHKQI